MRWFIAKICCVHQKSHYDCVKETKYYLDFVSNSNRSHFLNLRHQTAPSFTLGEVDHHICITYKYECPFADGLHSTPASDWLLHLFSNPNLVTDLQCNDVKRVLSLWSRNGELIFPNMYINFKTFTVYCWICGLFTFCSLLLVKWFCCCCGNGTTTTDGRRSLPNIPTMKVYKV